MQNVANRVTVSASATRGMAVNVGELIGERLEALIAERGLSYRQLHLRLCELRPGTSEVSWRVRVLRWRQGQVPEPEQAQLLADALGVDVAEFQPAAATQADYDDVCARLETTVRLLEEAGLFTRDAAWDEQVSAAQALAADLRLQVSRKSSPARRAAR